MLSQQKTFNIKKVRRIRVKLRLFVLPDKVMGIIKDRILVQTFIRMGLLSRVVHFQTRTLAHTTIIRSQVNHIKIIPLVHMKTPLRGKVRNMATEDVFWLSQKGSRIKMSDVNRAKIVQEMTQVKVKHKREHRVINKEWHLFMWELAVEMLAKDNQVTPARD